MINYCSKCGTGLKNGVCPNCGNTESGGILRTHSNQQWENSGHQYQASNHEMVCPRCGNKDLQMVTQSNLYTEGKDFSAGKGCLGFLFLGPLGLLCGMCGEGKQMGMSNTLSWICPKCGMTVSSQNTGGKTEGKKGMSRLAKIILLAAAVAIPVIILLMIIGTIFGASYYTTVEMPSIPAGY